MKLLLHGFIGFVHNN